MKQPLPPRRRAPILALAGQVDAGVGEGAGDALGEVLEGVGDLGALAGGQLQVVDLIDEEGTGRTRTASIRGVAAGGAVT